MYAELNFKWQIYSLDDSCSTLITLEARPIETGKTPVTLGSNVPPWPVASNSNESLNQAATWWDEGPACLFITIIPDLSKSSILLIDGGVPYGAFVVEDILCKLSPK